MSKTKVIAIQEFRMMAANKAFIVATLLGPFFIAAITILPTLLSSGMNPSADEIALGITNENPEVAASISQVFSTQGYEVVSGSREELRKELLAGRLDGFIRVPSNLLDPGEISYYSATGTDIYLSSSIESTFKELIRKRRIQEAGLSDTIIDRILESPRFVMYTVDEEGDSGSDAESGFLTVFITAMTFVMIIYMTVLLYGQAIGRSVVKEKTSKTVELLLSSVKPHQMMFGKILGIGIAGLIQYAFWVILVGGGMILAESLFDLSLTDRVPLGNLGWLVAFFVTAYFLYGAGYAAIGAAAEDEQNLGQLALPLILFLIIPLVMISTFVMNPGSTIAVVLSLFPMTSSLVMMMRIMIGDPAVWEIVLCFVLQIAAFWAFAVFGGRIFRNGILMSGTKMKLKDLKGLLKA